MPPTWDEGSSGTSGCCGVGVEPLIVVAEHEDRVEAFEVTVGA